MELFPFIIYFQIETLPPYKHRNFIIYTQRVTNIERGLLVVLWCEWLLPRWRIDPKSQTIKKESFQVGKENFHYVKHLLLRDKRVFTSCQNSWTNFRFHQQIFAGQLSLWIKIFAPTSLVLGSIRKQKLDARSIEISIMCGYRLFVIKGLTGVKKHHFKLT